MNIDNLRHNTEIIYTPTLVKNNVICTGWLWGMWVAGGQDA